MRALLLAMVAAFAGCVSAKQQVANEYLDCLDSVKQDQMIGKITPSMAVDLRRGCDACYYLEKQRLRR